MIDLTGQALIVIGGSSGIGFATAKLAAELGADVTIASRSEDKLAAAAKRIGTQVSCKVLDVTSDSSVEGVFGDGTIWDHVIVTGSDVSISFVRELPLGLTPAEASDSTR